MERQEHSVPQGSSFNNDLALFELDEPVMLSEDIMPICVERSLFVDELLRGGRLGIVTGCGSLYEEGRSPLYLNEVSRSCCCYCLTLLRLLWLSPPYPHPLPLASVRSLSFSPFSVSLPLSS